MIHADKPIVPALTADAGPLEAMASMDQTKALLPCPICGKHAFIASSTVGYPVWCVSDMCLKLPARATEDEAIAAWNRRISHSLPGDVGALRDRIQRARDSAGTHYTTLRNETADAVIAVLTPSPCPGDVGAVDKLLETGPRDQEAAHHSHQGAGEP